MNEDYTQRDIDDIKELRSLENKIRVFSKGTIVLKIIKHCLMDVTTRFAHDDTFLGWEVRPFRDGYTGYGMAHSIEGAIQDWFRDNFKPKQLCKGCAEFFHNVRLGTKPTKGVCPTCGSASTFEVIKPRGGQIDENAELNMEEL